METAENRVRRLSVHTHSYLTVLWKVRYFSRSCGSEPSGRCTSRWLSFILLGGRSLWDWANMDDSETRSAMACWWSLRRTRAQWQRRFNTNVFMLSGTFQLVKTECLCIPVMFQYLQLVEAPTISLSLFLTEKSQSKAFRTCVYTV